MRKKHIEILHIYPGASGASGSYIDGIYKSLNNFFKQDCLVNFYFPYKYGNKIFYRFTDLSSKNKFIFSGNLRLIFRMLELIYGLIWSFIFIITKKIKVINYSMTSNFAIEFFFLLLLKKFTDSTIVITCHDVLPFQTKYSNINNDIKKRKKFFDIADYLLIHNENSKRDLINHYQINQSKILSHNFPVMDLKKFIVDSNINNVYSRKHKFKLSFIGHMRKEKGLNILLEAWKKYQPEDMQLSVVGNFPLDNELIIKYKNSKNLLIENKFLSDSEYACLIHESDFVILPYTYGTNSGIPGSIISLGSIPVTSNIEMFKNNELISKEFIFNKNDVGSLESMLNYINNLDPYYINQQNTLLKENLNLYSKKITKEINDVYNFLLNK